MKLCFLVLLSVFTISCGRAPSSLLRQGQSPVFDFPLYVTEGAMGQVTKFDHDGSSEVLVSGLSDPRGIATDKFNNLYVVEQGLGRLIRVDVDTGEYEVEIDGLSTPSIVAVNSFSEAFVTQDGSKNIVRASDGEVVASFSTRPTALAFGVEDIMLIGLFDEDRVQWGLDGPSTDVDDPVNISTDATGRVYVVEGLTGGAEVIRYHQRKPSGKTVVADALAGPSGMAVDPVGNIYFVEQGVGRIGLVTHDGLLYNWSTEVIDPQYLALTQY